LGVKLNLYIFSTTGTIYKGIPYSFSLMLPHGLKNNCFKARVNIVSHREIRSTMEYHCDTDWWRVLTQV